MLAGPDRGQVEADGGDSQEGERAREVVEAIRLRQYRGHREGRLDGEGSGYAGNQGLQERVPEARQAQEVLHERHVGRLVGSWCKCGRVL